MASKVAQWAAAAMVAGIAVSAVPVSAQTSSGGNNVYVTVYNDNLGVIREIRKIDIASGTSEIRVTDVASLINPSTVKINLNGSVIEQNYQFDLVSAEKILQRFIDREVQFMDDKGNVITGTLLSLQGGSAVIRQSSGGILMLPSYHAYQVSVPDLPGGLITRPTLIWTVQSDRAGTQDVEMTYQTGGLSWQAEYVAVLKDNDTRLDLNAWVNLTNYSGAQFENAQLKLVAGNVNRVMPPVRIRGAAMEEYAMASLQADKQFTEQGLFEYHMYTLQRPTTLMNNESKQVALFDAESIPVVKRYVYSGEGRGTGAGNPVNVKVEFKNEQKNGLGIPMPKGIVRVNQSSDESIEFIGEDHVNHTPRDEKISLTLGQAFDVLGETTVVEQRRISDKVHETSYKVVVKNRKDTPVTVEVERNMYGNWEIIRESQAHRKNNAFQVTYDVNVPANSEKELTYTVRVSN